MRLLIQSGSQAGRAYDVAKDTMTIGRDVQSDIPLSDPSTSRTHCQIRRVTGGYLIQDANSVNGTFVNNQRIAGPHPLRAGDVLRVGSATFLVQEGSSPAGPNTARHASSAGGMRNAPAGPVTPAHWALVGGGFLGLLIIGLFFTLLMKASGPSTPSAAVMLPPTQIPPPVASATALVTATRVPATATVLVAALPIMPTGGVTVTPTLSPTVTQTPAPTAQPPTVVPTRLYPAPRAIYGQPNGKYHRSDAIVLTWTTISELRASDYYFVQIALDSDFGKIACEIQTKDSFIQLPGEISAPCNDNWRFNNIYFWRVRIVFWDSVKITLLSPEQSDIYQFAWQD